MARVARPVDPRKIRHLKEQIQDPYYLQDAVDSLAGRITDRLLGFEEGSPFDASQRLASTSRNDIAVLLTDRE